MFNAQKQTLHEFHEMASVASELIEEVTAHAQSDSLNDARDICADGTYFPDNLRMTANKSQPEESLNLKEISCAFRVLTLRV